MNPFIRVTEIWLPTEDRTALRYGSGLYGELSGFKAVSEGTRFGFGEGLPGRAWAERRPIILKQLEGSYFRRGEAARAAGLTCGVALPIFAGDFLLAVVVFFCGGDYDHVGAIEIWMNDPAVSGQMTRADGYYGTAELFERDSGTAFGRGHGLPGQTWAAGVPVFAGELYRATRVLRRGESALRVGENTGIGLPFASDPGRNWVMTFLSASGTPVARRFESWLIAESPDRLIRDAVSGEGSRENAKAIGRDEGALGRVLLTGLPFVSTDLAGESPLGAAEIESASLGAMVALPILTRDGRLVSVAAWYF